MSLPPWIEGDGGLLWDAIIPQSERRGRFHPARVLDLVDEQPDHDVVHLNRFGEADRLARQPLDPRVQPRIEQERDEVVSMASLGVKVQISNTTPAPIKEVFFSRCMRKRRRRSDDTCLRASTQT